jgi:serine phosphatase RsbU (regulator of sigma subunit)
MGGVSRALWLVNEAGTDLELVHPESHRRAAAFTGIPLSSDLPGAAVVRTGEPVFIATRDERDRRFPALADVGPQVGIAVLPLTSRDRVVGVLACSFDEEHAFGEGERNFLAAITELASQALERSRLHARDIEVSRALQASLLPPALPVIPGLELAAAYHPAWEGTEVGGDFYDVFPLSGGSWGLMIGDVCGTGPQAAALTAQVRHTVRAATRTGLGIEAATTVLNDILVDSLDFERFCTMVLVEARPGERGVSLDLVRAGHPTSLVVRSSGAVEEIRPTGSLLGVEPSLSYRKSSLRLEAGDALVLYTDGVTEARSAAAPDGEPPTFFGLDGLSTVLGAVTGAGAGAIVKAVESALMDFTGGRLADDVAILVVRAER